MIRFRNCRLSILLLAFVLTLACAGYAQDVNSSAQSQIQADTVQVPTGQKIEIEGVVLENQSNNNLIVRSMEGGTYIVSAMNAEFKERKSNPFRGAKRYSKTDLVPGLRVEVKGTGTDSGAVSATEIRCTNDDFKMAQTMNERVVPVENKLSATQARLGETEQNAKRLSGQVQELAAASKAATQKAQDSADKAMLAANNARTVADDATAGVHAANQRITSLDQYDVIQTATVHFRAGSARLSQEDMAQLESLATAAKDDVGFLIEVAGFASSDGNAEYNRRLSQKRADAVIQYMAGNFSIPMRRFVIPMGYGENQPVADNGTHEGRVENRRVEVRILASKGLTAPSQSATTD